MNILAIKDLDDLNRELTLESGEKITLRIEGSRVEILLGEVEIGELDFRPYIDLGLNGQEEQAYHLTHAFIEGGGGIYTNRGLGTEAFRFFRQHTGAEITFSPNDGIQRGDGSHLTGNGAVFVESLKRKIRDGIL